MRLREKIEAQGLKLANEVKGPGIPVKRSQSRVNKKSKEGALTWLVTEPTKYPDDIIERGANGPAKGE